jgi:hypothetical protein
MKDKSQALANFWRVFQEHSGALAASSNADNPVYDLILDQLQRIHPAIYFEFSSGPGTSKIIITAEGDSSLFPLVDSIVAGAPKISDWSVLSLKPKLGFPVTTTWEGISVTIGDLVFDPMDRKGSEDLGLRIFVPGLAPENTEDAHNAILRALDHALGEREFANSVQYTEVFPLPVNASPRDYIPITALEDYIIWRRKEMK